MPTSLRDRRLGRNQGFWAPDRVRFRRSLPFSDALSLLNPDQVPPSEEQVRQRAGDEQAVGVLRDAAVAYLGKPEHPLDHSDRVLDPSADARARTVDLAFVLGEVLVAAATPLGVVT